MKQQFLERVQDPPDTCPEPVDHCRLCNPALLAPECRTPWQMRLANALCRFVEIARVRLPSPVSR